MDLPVGDDAPKARVPLTISLLEIISRRDESQGHIFHRAFNAKCDRSIAEPYRSVVKSRLMRQRRLRSILNARLKNAIKNRNANQFIYIYIFAMRHETFTFI